MFIPLHFCDLGKEDGSSAHMPGTSVRALQELCHLVLSIIFNVSTSITHLPFHSYKLWYVYGGGLVSKSCPTLYDPMDCSLPGSSVHGILQVKILEWAAMPFSKGGCFCGSFFINPLC